jgi:hypothetical protein
MIASDKRKIQNSQITPPGNNVIPDEMKKIKRVSKKNKSSSQNGNPYIPRNKEQKEDIFYFIEKSGGDDELLRKLLREKHERNMKSFSEVTKQYEDQCYRIPGLEGTFYAPGIYPWSRNTATIYVASNLIVIGRTEHTEMLLKMSEKEIVDYIKTKCKTSKQLQDLIENDSSCGSANICSLRNRNNVELILTIVSDIIERVGMSKTLTIFKKLESELKSSNENTL